MRPAGQAKIQREALHYAANAQPGWPMSLAAHQIWSCAENGLKRHWNYMKSLQRKKILMPHMQTGDLLYKRTRNKDYKSNISKAKFIRKAERVVGYK